MIFPKINKVQKCRRKNKEELSYLKVAKYVGIAKKVFLNSKAC